MARLFDDASLEYLYGALTLGPPFTMACWARTDSAALAQNAMCLVSPTNGDDMFILEFAGEIANDPVRFSARAPGTGSVYSTTYYATNTWHHLCGVAAASNSRAVYLDGGGKGTGSVNKGPVTPTRVSIGARADFTVAAYLSGAVAEAAIWNVALTDAEVESLAHGISPLAIRPESLVFYPPLVRDEDRDIVGGLALTAVNTPSIDTHPPVFYLAGPRVGVPGAAGGTDALTGADLTGGTPALDTPTIGQIQALTATDLTAGTPTLDIPAVGQTHALTAADLTAGTPAADTPNIGQVHGLTSADLTAGTPAADTPAIGQTHALTASDLAAGTPALDAPAMGQVHVLTGADLTAGTPTLDATTLGQIHALTGADLTCAIPTVDAPTLETEGTDVLTASDLMAGTPTLDTPTLGQVHALTAVDLTASTPTLDAPTIGQVHALTASDLTAGTPTLDAPTAGETSTTTITLTWQDNAEHEDGFSIERDDGGGFAVIETVAAGVETYDDTVDTGHTYTYRVKATSAALGDSEYSNEAEVTV